MASSPFFEPRADVIGMADGWHDPERCAAERGTQFSHQFLEGVFLAAIGSTLIAVEARTMPGRVTVMPISA